MNDLDNLVPYEEFPVEDDEPELTMGGSVESRPMTPRDELEKVLEEDQSRLGDVYRLHVQERLPAQEVADRLNIETPGFVYSYRARIDAILDGKVSSSPTVQAQTASAVRSLLKRSRADLGADAIRLLNSHLALIEQALAEAESSEAVVAESETGDDANVDSGTLDRKPGIYAFSYGWYLERPLDEKSGDTLIKVGRADDVGQRIRQHRGGARAHMPEPLVVVRVYSTGDRDLELIEKQFHRLLSTAGHNNPRRSGSSRRNEVGREWFMTNEAFLDAIASVLGLRTEYIGRSAFVE